MSDKPLIDNGIYPAKARDAKITKTQDGVPFVEVSIEVTELYQSSPFVNQRVRLHWRAPLTRGGIKKAFHALMKMGAKMKLNEATNEVEDPLEGVGSKIFNVECVTLECEDNEAPGKFRTYAKVI